MNRTLFFLIFIVLALAGCNSKRSVSDYHVMLLDEVDGNLIVSDLSIAGTLYSGEMISDREGAPERLTVTYKGSSYTGTYSGTERYPGTATGQDRYSAEGDSECMMFAVSAADQLKAKYS